MAKNEPKNRTVSAYEALEKLTKVLPGATLHKAAKMLSAQATRAVARFSPERYEMAKRNFARAARQHSAHLESELTGSRPQKRKKTAGFMTPEKAANNMFGTYMRYWIDSTRLMHLNAPQTDAEFSYQGFEHIENSVAKNKGTILVLPHLGGWEWSGCWLTRIPGYQVTAVVEDLDDEQVRAWMKKWRETLGFEVLALGEATGPELLKRLKANHIVALPADRNIGQAGVPVDFFGETTELPAGPAMLALRSGASIVPVAVYHQGRFNHAIVEPPIEVVRKGKLKADMARITQDIAKVIETQIRRCPQQWLVLQPNWPSDAQPNRLRPSGNTSAGAKAESRVETQKD